jgi:hypothetical protein
MERALLKELLNGSNWSSKFWKKYFSSKLDKYARVFQHSLFERN